MDSGESLGKRRVRVVIPAREQTIAAGGRVFRRAITDENRTLRREGRPQNLTNSRRAVPREHSGEVTHGPAARHRRQHGTPGGGERRRRKIAQITHKPPVCAHLAAGDGRESEHKQRPKRLHHESAVRNARAGGVREGARGGWWVVSHSHLKIISPRRMVGASRRLRK